MKKLKNLKTQKHLKGGDTMKKAISTVLVAAMLATGAGNAFAWVPSDTDDPKCIDIRNLDEKRIIQYPDKGKKVCGCKTCEVAAMTFDKLEEYISKIEKEMSELDEDIRTNDKKWSTQKLHDLNKVAGRELALRYMSSDIAAKNYKDGNYYFVAMNYDVGEADAIGTFAKKEGIEYNAEYDETYFNEIKDRIKNILKAREGKYDEDSKAFYEMLPKLESRELKILGIALLALPVVLVLIGTGFAYVSGKIEQAKAKKNIDVKPEENFNSTPALSADESINSSAVCK